MKEINIGEDRTVGLYRCGYLNDGNMYDLVPSVNQASETVRRRDKDLFESACQSFGSANIVSMLARHFGRDPTSELLDALGIAGPLPGERLVDIYTSNQQ